MAKQEEAYWSEVEKGVRETYRLLASATREEEFRSVGASCLETLISLAKTIYDPKANSSAEENEPPRKRANRIIKEFIGGEFSTAANTAARKHAKGALKHANVLNHRGTTSYREAALGAEATRTVVNGNRLINPTSHGRRRTRCGPGVAG